LAPIPSFVITSLRWDIFCRVVDNFGDAGVCWRLARQLAREHGLAVTLWIDDVGSLARLVPVLADDADDQGCDGVRVRRWRAVLPPHAPVADVVIEAFGCGLPDDYVAAMTRAARPPVWIVLEYLSAEPWIEASHRLPSPHPRLPLTRWFWFPGFTPATGGVLREQGLLARRDALRAAPGASARIWGDADRGDGNTYRVSLFCYENPALPALLDCWAEGDPPVACLVPDGVARSALDRWAGGNVPHPGAPIARGRLTLAVAPFTDQDAFDQRLWSANLNIVRGEDSFVRAQWAGRPFAWHIYPKEGDVHMAKMDAFLIRFESGLAPAAATAQRAFWYAWNAGAGDALAAAWPAFRDAAAALETHGEHWARALASQVDLAEGLVRFSENRL
jgi:uncharacterized repeat protein (TIGR03837 family)